MMNKAHVVGFPRRCIGCGNAVEGLVLYCRACFERKFGVNVKVSFVLRVSGGTISVNMPALASRMN